MDDQGEGRSRPDKIARACALVCLLSMVWLFPTRAFAQLSEARKTVQQARGLAVNGQCDLAIAVYDRAIQLSPSRPELLRERGGCHEQLGHRKAAADDYRAYCAVAPTAPDVPALRQRIADLEVPVAARPEATPIPAPVLPSAPPAGAGPDTVPLPQRPRPPTQFPPSVQRTRSEEVSEDSIRFRGGVSVAAGGVFASGLSGFQAGVDGRVGIQINSLLGVYLQPHLVFGPASDGGNSSVIGVLAGTGVVDLTLFDRLFLGAGGGFGIVNSPYGPVVHFRIGGYPAMGRGESGGRRKGLMFGADVRIYLTDVATAVEATGGIGYEAF
jgi:hypothetical protein